MGRLLLRWILLAVSVIAASAVTQALGLGFETVIEGFSDFLLLMLGVAVLAFLNATLGRLLKLLTIPLNCLTLGIFSLVINALMLMLASSLQMGFRITEEGGLAKFIAAFAASLLISFINGVLGTFLPDREDE
jgi:putative membrane protein